MITQVTTCSRLLLLLLLQGADIMVTGTLGLAAPKTGAAMKAAAQMVKAGGGKVGVICKGDPAAYI
jgi:hypothetical protein